MLKYRKLLKLAFNRFAKIKPPVTKPVPRTDIGLFLETDTMNINEKS